MSASRLGFQPLEPSRMHDFWLVTWLSVVGFGVFLGFTGQSNDWLRLLLFTVGTALGQFNARKHPSISILGFLLCTLVIYGWMYLDPTSAMQRLQIGMSMFAFFATGSVFTIGVYCGLGAVMLGVIFASVPFWVHPLQGLMPMLQIVSGGGIGAVVNTLIVNLEQTRDRLEQAVMIDALTGLENRRALPIAFERHRAQSLRDGKPLLVTLWDLNNLKSINDSKGHNAGDEHLKNFAQVLKLETREQDLFYRTGGDEFVGLHLGMIDGVGLRDRVQARFADVAVGWSVVLEDLETTLHTADQMMYEAKKMQKSHSAK
jgi:GGDEF domain-containing protein